MQLTDVCLSLTEPLPSVMATVVLLDRLAVAITHMENS